MPDVGHSPRDVVNRSRTRAIVAILAAGLMTASCATSPRLPAPPAVAAIEHDFLGLPDARFHLRDTTPIITAWTAAERRVAAANGGRMPVQHMLALSGGGENGAFGAGILYGWSQRGDRPSFEIVTGVSTGALIAPLAFLGPRHDPTLKAVYTSIDADDIATLRPLAAVLTGDSVADTAPLLRLIERTLSDSMIDEIAAEHAKGRRLLIGTTNLDIAQPVIWNIGAIASLKTEEARQSIRRILLASASIPGAFPPVMIDMTAQGQQRHEMHVDGGATMQVFLYPSNIPLRNSPPDIRNRKRIAWIIRNGRTIEQPEETRRGLVQIATRSISTMITANSLGDIYRTYLTARRDGVDFNLAHITSAFSRTTDKPFERAYMNALFEHGRQGMLARRAWAKHPPGYAP